MEAAYDICKLQGDTIFQKARPTAKNAYTFWRGSETLVLGKKINEGASGAIHHGSFRGKDIAIKINNPGRRSTKADAEEVLMQIRLHCAHLPATLARIPSTFFAVSVPGVGNLLGMERVDKSLLAHVSACPASQQSKILRSSLQKTARLLQRLQRTFQFMHGDLHGENVMIRNEDEIFLIDFGMSSIRAKGGGATSRIVTDVRYKGVPFHRQLDLLTLLSSLREDFAAGRQPVAAAVCHAVVGPFWTAVRGALLSGTEPGGGLPYNVDAIVETALMELKTQKKLGYAHHLLYESIGDVNYPACSPATFLANLTSTQSRPTPAKTSLGRAMFVEDIRPANAPLLSGKPSREGRTE